MTAKPELPVARRLDAQRNRARLLAAARLVFAETTGGTDAGSKGGASAVAAAGVEQSMAEVARRAGVGRATLYRNFPTRRDLLEALFVDDVETIVTAVAPCNDQPGAALITWLHRFAEFESSKHAIVTELLHYADITDPMFHSSRQRVLNAGAQLLDAAQRAGQIRTDVTLEHCLDLVLAVVGLDRRPEHIELVLAVALDGLRTQHNRPDR